jgi:hypothetical protein
MQVLMQHRTRQQRLQAALGLAALFGCVFDASAVVTVTAGYTGVRTLTMRVGTPTAGAVDTVQFNVVNPATGNSQTSAPSVNGNGVAIAANSGGVPITMNMRVPSGNLVQRFTMTVTSPPDLTCVSGGCGSTTIPFSTISWIATPTPSGNNSAFDFQSGTFAAGSTQSMNNFPTTTNTTLNSAATVDFSSTLTFSYSNVTAYPAGIYSGTVVYTATLP